MRFPAKTMGVHFGMLFLQVKAKRTHFGIINALEKLLFSVEPGWICWTVEV